MRPAVLVLLAVVLVAVGWMQLLQAHIAEVTATVESDPVRGGDDAADDPAIWIHPSDPGRSTVIGTDKTGGGLAVYDMAGNELQYDDSVTPNNVDLRYGFPLGGASVDLVGFSNKDGSTIETYVVDPGTRLVKDVAAGPIESGFSPSGFCLYRSSVTGRFFGVVVSSDGEVEQWRLFDDGSGRVAGRLVRSFDVGGESEGCVADDLNGYLYVSEESVGIWKYGAEPIDGDARTLVDEVGSDGHLTADVEGLAIYQAAAGDGYLIASSQGNDSFVIYERRGNDYVGTVMVVDGVIDGIGHTDGIEVTNAPLGSDFSEGLFVAQDGSNPGGNQNFKYVPWEAIARSFDPRLRIDEDFDPRQAVR
jgi:3-phytase